LISTQINPVREFYHSTKRNKKVFVTLTKHLCVGTLVKKERTINVLESEQDNELQSSCLVVLLLPSDITLGFIKNPWDSKGLKYNLSERTVFCFGCRQILLPAFTPNRLKPYVTMAEQTKCE
jgi:hypothetical protein